MNRQEIKVWAREKIKGEFWPLLGTILVASILTNLSYYTYHEVDGHLVASGFSFGWILYFVQVGLIYYLVKVVKDEKHEFGDLFHFGNDFLRCLGAVLLQAIFIFLWALLLFVPGIIKVYAYAMVPYLLADDKYKNLSVTEILKKSQEIMNGHKSDLFVFQFSFFLWHMLGLITCGIAEFYVIPYQNVATARFMNDIKEAYEGKDSKTTKKSNAKYCPQCGKELVKDADFCSECGHKIK